MTVLKSLMSHMIEILKNISQQVHTSFVSLKSAEQFCNEELKWLSPTFNLWGPYTQFLERFMVLMAKKLDLLDTIISMKEGLDIVKELIGFFTRKLHVIQEKLKFLS